MGAVSGLRDSDTLHIDSLTFDVEGPSPIAGPHALEPQCLSKTPGDVGFVLSVGNLGLFPSAEIPLRLVPDGPPGPRPRGRVRQAYLVAETPDVDIRYPGGDMHVDRVHGRIVLDVTERIPWTETRSCATETRYVRADVVSDPEASQLEIHGSSAGSGTTVRVTSLALTARAASIGFDVGIHVSRNECGVVGVVPGGTQRFVASVQNVPSGARNYAWSVRGGTIVGHANLPHLEVALSAAPAADPAPVHVELRVEIAGLSATVATVFKPDTPVQRRAKELLCELQRHAFHNVRSGPPAAAIRDGGGRPFTREELVVLRQAASGLLLEIEAALRREE